MARHPEKPPIDIEWERVLLWLLKGCLMAFEAGEAERGYRLYDSIMEHVSEAEEMP